jgi:hypothetical protein
MTGGIYFHVTNATAAAPVAAPLVLAGVAAFSVLDLVPFSFFFKIDLGAVSLVASAGLASTHARSSLASVLLTSLPTKRPMSLSRL